MPFLGPLSCSPNNRVDPQIETLIDRLCTERGQGSSARKVYLSDTAQKIKTCVAAYTTFNLIHRITEFIKSIFGGSDWQLAKNVLHSSLVGRNLSIFSNDQAMTTADKILASLAKSNEQNVCVSAILSYHKALKTMNEELAGVAPDCFELGQYEFNVLRPPGTTLAMATPRLLFN